MEILKANDRRRAPLDKIRAAREQLLGEIETAAEGQLSLDETVRWLLDRLREPAERAQQSVLAFSRPDVSPSLPELDAAFLLWLDPKAFEAQLRARLKGLLPASAPSLASRPAAIAKLRERVRELELQEEREWLRLMRSGLLAERRLDADVQIILAAWDESDEAAA